MVFFALAMLISTTTYAYVERSAGHDAVPAVDGGCEPAQTLSVFLKASLGCEVSLGIGDGLVISGREEIATCIGSELDALGTGRTADEFAPLNEVLLSVLEGLAGVGRSAHLWAYTAADASHSPLLILEHTPCTSENRYSASCVLPGADGRSHLVVLVLAPALLPELGQI